MNKAGELKEPPIRIEHLHKSKHVFSSLTKNIIAVSIKRLGITVPEKHCLNLENSAQPLPIVVAVMDAKRPNTQENGRDMAIAPEPIFPTCSCNNNIRV